MKHHDEPDVELATPREWGKKDNSIGSQSRRNPRSKSLGRARTESDAATTVVGSDEQNKHDKHDKDTKYEGKEIVGWDGKDDMDNPLVIRFGVSKREIVFKLRRGDRFNWSKRRKWVLTLTTCFISILTGLPAGAYGAGNAYMERDFGISQTNFPWLFFATTSWNVGAALFPLLFVPLTENTGRMPGYFVSYILFCIFLIPSGVAPNFRTMIITRFFGGGFSSVSINIVGGTISDIWKGPEARSLPMSIFGFTSVAGIALGPFVGGAIQAGPDWHWIYWCQLIWCVGLLPVFWFILKETRGDVILARRAKHIRKETGRPAYAESELDDQSIWQMLAISFKRPTKMLFTEFVVASFTLWVSFAWGILFLFQSSVALTFSNNYGFSVFQTGLVQLALSAGALVATCLDPIQTKLYLQSAKRNKEAPGKPIPEARLYASVPGSLIFAGGLFMYGWTSYPSVHYMVPTVGVGLVGFGIWQIYQAVVNYLTDAYSRFNSSALSAASLGRNAFGAFLPLASQNLYNNLGYQAASSLLGGIGLVLSIVPVILLLKGPQLRKRSPFMAEANYADDESEDGKDAE